MILVPLFQFKKHVDMSTQITFYVFSPLKTLIRTLYRNETQQKVQIKSVKTIITSPKQKIKRSRFLSKM